MDIKCLVCGEPYEASCLDMLRWEAKLFKEGAGCPCCEGVSNGFEISKLSDIENGDEDPMLRINAAENVANGTAPKWIRPEDPLRWACADCGIQVKQDVDTEELYYHAPYKSRTSYEYWHRNQDAPETPEFTFDSGTTVCEKCFCTCSVCKEAIEPGDDNGSFEDPRNGYHDSDRVCSEDCLSTAEQEEAESVWSSFSQQERLDYIRDRENEFDSCLPRFAKTPERQWEAWRKLLANVRGKEFSGYTNELIGR